MIGLRSFREGQTGNGQHIQLPGHYYNDCRIQLHRTYKGKYGCGRYIHTGLKEPKTAVTRHSNDSFQRENTASSNLWTMTHKGTSKHGHLVTKRGKRSVYGKKVTSPSKCTLSTLEQETVHESLTQDLRLQITLAPNHQRVEQFLKQ